MLPVPGTARLQRPGRGPETQLPKHRKILGETGTHWGGRRSRGPHRPHLLPRRTPGTPVTTVCDDPPCGHRTTWGGAGLQVHSCPQRLPGRSQVPAAVTRQDDRGPSSMPRSHAASWKGVETCSAGPPGDSGPQTSDLNEDSGLDRKEATIRSSRFQSALRPHLHNPGQHTHHC